MTIGKPRDVNMWSSRRNFLSHPHTNSGFFFLLTTKYRILYLVNMKKASKKSWNRWNATWWRHFFFTLQCGYGSTCGRRATVRFFFNFSLGRVRVCEIELSHMGKNNGNPDLVCEKNCFSIPRGKSMDSRCKWGRCLMARDTAAPTWIYFTAGKDICQLVQKCVGSKLHNNSSLLCKTKKNNFDFPFL